MLIRLPGIFMASRYRYWLFSVLLAMSQALPAATAIRSLDISNPRPFGYVIGDVFQREINLVLNDPYRLDPASIPAAGPVAIWLERRPPELTANIVDGGIHYRLRLTYQLLNSPEQLQTLAIPDRRLKITDANRSVIVNIPDWRFDAAPLGDSSAAPQPDTLPPPINDERHRWQLWLAGTGTAIAALALLVVGGLLPILTRQRRAFSRAWRDLNRLRHQPWTEIQQRMAVRRLHRAINETAGYTVFSADLERFLHDNPRFGPLKAQLLRLFDNSGQLFFSPTSSSQLTLAELIDLARRGRRYE